MYCRARDPWMQARRWNGSRVDFAEWVVETLPDCRYLDMSNQPTTHVISSSFEVRKSRPETLEAFLGTCVGVAIVDRKANVGGLYHILLSEHPSESAPFSAESYARTGMPLFLQALRDAGGKADSMEATLAGGALIGKVSRLDLHLDVGGRTVEVVHQELQKAGIPVVHSQTGGFFGIVLSLNLKTLRCDIAPMKSSAPSSVEPVVKPTTKELDQAIAQIQPIPQVALKIIRTMQSDEFHLWDVSREIRHDQVISAHVLKMCNSAYVSPQVEIESIDQALLILGVQQVYQFILSSVMTDFFEFSGRGYSMSKGGFYHHAVSTAIVSEQISKLTGRADPEIAYTAGLLHDIGKVLLDQYVASAFPMFYGKLAAGEEPLLSAEKTLLGISHNEAGERLAELWGFPPSLKDVIAHHEQPERAQHNRDLVTVVHLADLLVWRFNSGYELGGIGTDCLPARLQQLGLDSKSLPDLIARIPWGILDTPGYFQSL